MIKVINLTKKYNIGKANEIIALSNISLEINDGEMVAIVGASGAGKSTLLNQIALLDDSDKLNGEIIIDGKNIKEVDKDKRNKFRVQHLGYIVQDFALIDDYTVYENIELALLFSGKKYIKKEIDVLILTTCKNLHIDKYIDTLIKNLSGGEKQRVAIARTLVTNVKNILADEPTGQLDKKTSNEIINILKNLKKDGKSIIIVTHNDEIAKVCDRIIHIEDGKLII